jgi:CRP-like cAMP-binding protein
MSQTLQFLSPLQFQRGQKILQELDEVTEIYFIVSGYYDIGFEINKKEKYVLR